MKEFRIGDLLTWSNDLPDALQDVILYHEQEHGKPPYDVQGVRLTSRGEQEVMLRGTSDWIHVRWFQMAKREM